MLWKPSNHFLNPGMTSIIILNNVLYSLFVWWPGWRIPLCTCLSLLQWRQKRADQWGHVLCPKSWSRCILTPCCYILAAVCSNLDLLSFSLFFVPYTPGRGPKETNEMKWTILTASAEQLFLFSFWLWHEHARQTHCKRSPEMRWLSFTSMSSHYTHRAIKAQRLWNCMVNMHT